MGAQALPDEQNIMQCREDGEGKSRAQEKPAADRDPGRVVHFKEKHKENGGDLSKGIGLAENTGAEIAQSGDGVEHGAGGKDGNVAAEHDDRELPGNFVQDREHQEDGAEQKFVSDGIEILAEHGLLLEGAGEQTIEPVAKSGEDEEDEGPGIMAIQQAEHDEGKEHHPQ